MIDIHHHLLFGLDDGPTDIEISVAMAEMSIQSGVTHIVCTPHSSEHFKFDPALNLERLEMVQKRLGNRISLAPDIPTVAETLPGFDLGIWQSIVVPAKTSPDIIDKLHKEVVAVLGRDSVRSKLITNGVEPATSKSPADFAAFLRSQADTRRKVIEAVGIKLD